MADLTIDLLSHRVTRGNVRIDIQPLEFQLLEYLVRNTGRVVSKTMIMEHVWEYNFDPQTNVVEARVCRLRDKIDKPFERKLIQTGRDSVTSWNDRKIFKQSNSESRYGMPYSFALSAAISFLLVFIYLKTACSDRQTTS
ncbi:MAG: winged helix-turn-helix domain-containing protein [Victivallales bacterium]